MSDEVAAAITGVGPVSSLGIGREDFWQRLAAGETGFRRLTRLDRPENACRVAAQIDAIEPPNLDAHRPEPRSMQLARRAAKLAWEDAGDPPAGDRTGLVVGSGLGHLDLVEHGGRRIREDEMLSPVVAFRGFHHATACELSRELGISGPIETVTSGCNSGADAIGTALDWLRLGKVDRVLVGGAEAELNETFFEAMEASRAFATQFNDEPSAASRPFDARRDGNVPGEGAGFMVLETGETAEARNAGAHANVSGFACRACGNRPAYDAFNPEFNPEPMRRTMTAALDDAGLTPPDITTVSANGSSSVFYDPFEARAIADLLGPDRQRTPVHSIKGATGQIGAVTPALQTIAAVDSLEEDRLPPTCNHEKPFEDCPIRIQPDGDPEADLSHILCNAIGFGGYYYASWVVSYVEH